MKTWFRWGGGLAVGLAGLVASAGPAAKEWPQFRVDKPVALPYVSLGGLFGTTTIPLSLFIH